MSTVSKILSPLQAPLCLDNHGPDIHLECISVINKRGIKRSGSIPRTQNPKKKGGLTDLKFDSKTNSFKPLKLLLEVRLGKIT